MFRKENFLVLAIIGLGIAYAVVSALVFLTRGKRGINKKIALGARIIILSALMTSGSVAFGQAVPTPDLPILLYGVPMPTATPKVTPEPVPEYGVPMPTATPKVTPEPVPEYGVPMPTATPAPSTLYGMPFEMGDVDNNRVVDVVDSLKIAMYVVDEDPGTFIPYYADVDSNDEIDIIDALLVAQKYVGIINEFPNRSKK